MLFRGAAPQRLQAKPLRSHVAIVEAWSRGAVFRRAADVIRPMSPSRRQIIMAHASSKNSATEGFIGRNYLCHTESDAAFGRVVEDRRRDDWSEAEYHRRQHQSYYQDNNDSAPHVVLCFVSF